MRFGRQQARGLALVLGLAVAGGALAQTAAQKAVTTRQAGYKQMGAAFKAINDELKADKPNATLIATNAKKMSDLAAQVPAWFPKGSGPEAGVKTRAKPEIWSDAAGFGAAARALQPETVKMQQLAMAGNLDGVRAQVRATGGACKGCHDKFRGPE